MSSNQETPAFATPISDCRSDTTASRSAGLTSEIGPRKSAIRPQALSIRMPNNYTGGADSRPPLSPVAGRISQRKPGIPAPFWGATPGGDGSMENRYPSLTARPPALLRAPGIGDAAPRVCRPNSGLHTLRTGPPCAYRRCGRAHRFPAQSLSVRKPTSRVSLPVAEEACETVARRGGATIATAIAEGEMGVDCPGL